MKLAILVLFLVCAAGLCSAQECRSDTINVAPMENFNFGMVYPKWWYVQEIYYRREEEVMEPVGRCIQQHVGDSFMPDMPTLREEWTTPSGQFNVHSWWAYPGIYWNDPAIWSVTQSWFVLQYKTTYAFTDYDTYGVMHWCALEGQSADVPFERVMVFTGSTTPNETLIEELRGMVASLGFPTQYSVRVNTTDCEYCFGEECPIYPIYDEEEGGKGEEDDFQTEN